MDINQISIKNNQIKGLDKDTAKTTTPTSTAAISFQEILASCSNKTEQLSSAPDQQEKSTSQEDAAKLTEEDWQAIESILSIFLAAQQGQIEPVSKQEMPTENNEGAELQSISNILQQIDGKLLQAQVVNSDNISKGLAEFDPTWLQDPNTFIEKVSSEVANLLEKQPLTGQQIQLIDRLGQFLMQYQENDASNQMPTEVMEKLEALFGTETEQDQSTKPVFHLSLDKNQVIQSTKAVMEKTSVNNNLDKALSTEQDMSNIPETAVLVNQPSGTNERNSVQSTPPSSPLPVSKFVPEISEWVGRFMRVSQDQNGKTETTLSLFPEHLGEIEVKISSQQGQVSAQILTDTMATKKVLEGQLHDLRQALQQHGLQVQSLDVIQQVSSTDLYQSNFSFSQSGSGYSQGQRAFNRDGGTIKKQTEKELREVEGEALSLTYGKAAPKLASNIDFTA